MLPTSPGPQARRPHCAADPLRSGRRLAAAVVTGLLISTFAAAPAPAAPKAGPTSTDRGSWSVRGLGGGRWNVSWTSPDRFPVASDRPTIVGPAGASIGAPTVVTDGRTVRAVITSAAAPKPAQLDVVLSGRTLDQGLEVPARRSAGQAADPAPAVRQLVADPGVPGPHRVVSSDYTRTPVKVAGMDQPIEMVGHVVEPAPDAATGPRPLVFFLHGRHEYCYQVGSGTPNGDWPCRGVMREIPSHLGYDYLQRLLASQGFTTVSVRVNGINAQDYALEDGGAGARATIVARHLDYWSSMADAHRVDLNRIVLAGHSRGGEGVNRASIRIPLTAPYRVVGQVLIAPTNFGTQTAPYVPTVTMLPYCDGDVSDLQGQRFTDAARDLSTDDRSLKSSVLVMGANHNYFNTEWTPGVSVAPSNDDWYGEPTDACGTASPDRLTAAQQRSVGQAYVAGAVRQFTAAADAAQPHLGLFDGSAVTVRSIGKARVHSHAIGGGRDVRRPSRDTTLTLPTGARSEFCTGSTAEDFRAGLCGSELAEVVTPHWLYRQEYAPTRKFLQVSWTARGQRAGLQLNRPLDLRTRALDLRMIVDPRLGDVAVKVRLTDTAGKSATLAPGGGPTVRRLLTAEGVTKLWAQNVRVDATPAAGTLDLGRVSRLEIVGDSPDGRVWIADAAAAPGRLPEVGAQRAPALSIGSKRVPEGSRPGTTLAEVPFRLSRPMPVAGQFQLVTAGEQEGSVRKLTVDLAPGQVSGTIPVGYQADKLDDPDTSATLVAAWATRNVITDVYLGQLVVLDDDPTPGASITRVRNNVKEGASAQWKVTFAGPVDYDAEVLGRVVTGPGHDLIGTDVPAAWLAEHASERGSTLTLARLGVQIYGVVPAGSTSVILSIPVRKEKKREGEEAVTLRVEALRTTSTSTVRVARSG